MNTASGSLGGGGGSCCSASVGIHRGNRGVGVHGCREFWFGGTVWDGSVDMSKEEELERGLKASSIAVGTGVLESNGVNKKRPGVFREVLNERRNLWLVELCR